MPDMNNIKLTQFSHGAGCGCKISPAVLSTILRSQLPAMECPKLLVGNESRDDAAVYDIGGGRAVISTTDFFMPIVDDPFSFGRIAAVNAISDIYAMGGTPLMAIAILGWPLDKLAPEIAATVVEGGRYACGQAGIPLAGGHSIDSPEPIFGLAVTGIIETRHLMKNNTATPGSRLYLTKPLGVGILTTAQKRGILAPEHQQTAPDSMCTLNLLGPELAKIEGVTAMTDVTGFGLLGHLSEVCEGSGVSAEIEWSKIPQFPEASVYLEHGCVPGGTHRNWDSYGANIELGDRQQRLLLCDPQTSGGLLVAVEQKAVPAVEAMLLSRGLPTDSIGILIPKQKPLIRVR